METPEVSLNSSERLALSSLAQWNAQEFTLDWIALQRLKSFGLVEETPQGLKLTATGRRAVGRARA